MGNNHIATYIAKRVLSHISANSHAFTGKKPRYHSITSDWSFTFSSEQIDPAVETDVEHLGERCWEQADECVRAAFKRRGYFAKRIQEWKHDWMEHHITRNAELVVVTDVHFDTSPVDFRWREGGLHYFIFNDEAFANAYVLTT